MATYVIPPGAWLSGSALQPGIGGHRAGLQPGIGGHSAMLQPGIGGHSAMLQPGIGGHSAMLQPGIGGNSTSDRLAAAAARLTVAAPWRGNNPEWVYEDGAPTMLAEAMTRSYARLVPKVDPRRDTVKGPFVNARPDGTDNADPLWRWGAEFRAQAVLADLHWRFAVSDACLWYLNKTNDQGRGVTFEESIGFADIPKSKEWNDDQIDKVLRAAVEREDRLPEILAQADDILPFFNSLVGIHPAVAPLTFELLAIAHNWATPLVMALKNQIAARRPEATSTRISTVIETPTHGSLPSGHATMSALMSRLYGELMFGKDEDQIEAQTEDEYQFLRHPKRVQLDLLARRIAFNRVVAGVHFTIDSRAGYALGVQLAAHFIGLATGKQQPKRYDLEFGLKEKPDLKEAGRPKKLEPRKSKSSAGVAESPLLGLVWRAACRELHELGVEGVPL